MFWKIFQFRSNDLLDQRDAGGDLEHVKQQYAFCRQMRQNVDEKQTKIDEVAKLAQSFLLQQDLRSLQSAVSRFPSDDSEKSLFLMLFVELL